MLLVNCQSFLSLTMAKKKANPFILFYLKLNFGDLCGSVGVKICIQVYDECFLHLKFIQRCRLDFFIPLSLDSPSYRHSTGLK